MRYFPNEASLCTASTYLIGFGTHVSIISMFGFEFLHLLSKSCNLLRFCDYSAGFRALL